MGTGAELAAAPEIGALFSGLTAEGIGAAIAPEVAAAAGGGAGLASAGGSAAGSSLGSGIAAPTGAGEILGAGGGAGVPLGGGITPGVASEAIGGGSLGTGIGPGVTGSLGALDAASMGFSPAAMQAIKAGGAAGATPGGGAALGAGQPGGQGLKVPANAALGGGGAPGAPGAAAGGAGVGGANTGGSFVDTLIKQMKDNALGLGLLGASTMMGAGQRTPIPNAAQLNGLGQQASGVASQLIGQYQSGTLSPGQQASIDQLTQNTKNQLRQYFASIGQSNSTAAAQAEAQVDQTAAGMKQQMLDGALQQGLSAIGVAQGPLNTIAQYELGQDQMLRQAFGNFAQATGTLLGRQAGTPQPQPGQTAAPTITGGARP